MKKREIKLIVKLFLLLKLETTKGDAKIFTLKQILKKKTFKNKNIFKMSENFEPDETTNLKNDEGIKVEVSEEPPLSVKIRSVR